MPDTTITPNMNLPVPVPGTAPGPDWANDIVADMYAIDGHDHASGQGVQITPDGLNINSDLTMGGNDLTNARTVRFTSQSAALSGTADIGCLYEVVADLYYNDGAGNQVRITQSGSVTGSAGTITGLPSGTASASFSGGTFTFQGATSTPATMNIGPIITGAATANSKTVTIGASASQPSNYALTWPLAAPGANQLILSDGSGNLSWTYGLVPIGAVIATFPNLTGAYSCTATTAADSFGFVKCNGQTIADGGSPMNGQVVPNINNTIFIAGSTTAGTSGGAATVTLSTGNLPSHTHGSGSYGTSVGVTGGTASLTGTTSFASTSHVHLMYHTHKWGLYYVPGVTDVLYTLIASDIDSTSIGISDNNFISNTAASAGAGSSALQFTGVTTRDFYTTGVIDSPFAGGADAKTDGPIGTGTVGISSTAASATGSNTVTGTSSATGSGTSFSILPSYITSLYVMRIK